MRNQELISALYNCAAHCYHCADACLDEEDIKMMVRCIRLDKICATTCSGFARRIRFSKVLSGNMSEMC